MKLPNAEGLVVEREKIVEYLLNANHRYGASKARFFSDFGFRLAEWHKLAEALRQHGRSHEVEHAYETGFGPRYVVAGILETPCGRSPLVQTVWQLDQGAIAPRLITAYPLEAES